MTCMGYALVLLMGKKLRFSRSEVTRRTLPCSCSHARTEAEGGGGGGVGGGGEEDNVL